MNLSLLLRYSYKLATLLKVKIAWKSVDCKINIQPRPVSIFFSDPVLNGQFLKSGRWPLYTGSTVFRHKIFSPICFTVGLPSKSMSWRYLAIREVTKWRRQRRRDVNRKVPTPSWRYCAWLRRCWRSHGRGNDFNFVVLTSCRQHEHNIGYFWQFEYNMSAVIHKGSLNCL